MAISLSFLRLAGLGAISAVFMMEPPLLGIRTDDYPSAYLLAMCGFLQKSVSQFLRVACAGLLEREQNNPIRVVNGQSNRQV